MLALSGRPPKPRPARHSAIAAAALFAVGIGCLALSGRDKPLLIVAGLVATILGTLLLGPLAIRTFSAVAGRVSIAPRLALRDLARYQARSGAALAAVTLSLGIAATVVVTASAQEAKQAKEPASLSDRQIRVQMGRPEDPKVIPIQTPADLDHQVAGVRQLAAGLDGATVLTLHKAAESGTTPAVFGNTRFRPTIELTKRFDAPGGNTSYRSDAELYVATPAVLQYLGIDPGTVAPSTDYLVDRRVQPEHARHSEHDQAQGVRRHERPEDRDWRASLQAGSGVNPHTSSRSTAFAVTAGSRFEPVGSSIPARP